MGDSNVEVVRARAVINEQFGIESFDDKFGTFFGETPSHRLVYYVHPSDVVRLDDAIKTVSNEGETVVAVRMVDGSKVYRWVMVHIKNAELSKENDGLYDIELQDVAVYDEKVTNIENKYSGFMEYFSLMEQLMFSYDVTSGKLRIFMMGSHQQINFYNGSLDNWRIGKLANDEIDPKSISAFERLCEDVKNGTASFEHEINMMLLETSVKKELCIIKGKTIVGSNGKKHVIATMSSVSAVSEMGDNSELAGMRDAGTDLLNKRAMSSYVRKMIENKSYHKVTIAIIDIDNFKNVNDQYGHMVGDEVIREVADIIKEAVEGKGVAGRIGGDEMMIAMTDVAGDEALRAVLRTIRNNVAWFNNGNDDMPHVTCSMGAATYPDNAGDYSTLFNIADKMLYLAKSKGKNRYIIFHNDLHAEYLGGTGKETIDEIKFYKYRKISVINKIVNASNKKESGWMNNSVNMTALAYGLDTIFIYEKNEDGVWNRHVLYGDNVPEQACEFMDKDNYKVDFNEEGVKVIDNIGFYERKAVTAFKEFTGIGLCQAVQVIVKEYDGVERVVSFNRNVQLMKWSDSDIMQLAIIGNVIGMGYGND